MELTEIQKGFLDKVCGDRSNWTLNSDGEIDVRYNISVDCNGILKILGCKSLEDFGIQFGKVSGDFRIGSNDLTSLNGIPRKFDNEYLNEEYHIIPDWRIYIEDNNLTNYFKNLKEGDFPHWDKIYWGDVIREYPVMINTAKRYLEEFMLIHYLNFYPLTKLYLE
jgi:hypothetical protein